MKQTLNAFYLLFSSGESVKISARTCFNVTYQGPTSDLHLTLPYQPQHGKVVKLPDYQTPISTFKVGLSNFSFLFFLITLFSPLVVRSTFRHAFVRCQWQHDDNANCARLDSGSN